MEIARGDDPSRPAIMRRRVLGTAARGARRDHELAVGDVEIDTVRPSVLANDLQTPPEGEASPSLPSTVAPGPMTRARSGDGCAHSPPSNQGVSMARRAGRGRKARAQVHGSHNVRIEASRRRRNLTPPRQGWGDGKGEEPTCGSVWRRLPRRVGELHAAAIAISRSCRSAPCCAVATSRRRSPAQERCQWHHDLPRFRGHARRSDHRPGGYRRAQPSARQHGGCGLSKPASTCCFREADGTTWPTPSAWSQPSSGRAAISAWGRGCTCRGNGPRCASSSPAARSARRAMPTSPCSVGPSGRLGQLAAHPPHGRVVDPREPIHYIDLLLWYFREHGLPGRVSAADGIPRRSAPAYVRRLHRDPAFLADGAYAVFSQCLGGFEAFAGARDRRRPGALQAPGGRASSTVPIRRTSSSSCRRAGAGRSSPKSGDVERSGAVFAATLPGTKLRRLVPTDVPGAHSTAGFGPRRRCRARNGGSA